MRNQLNMMNINQTNINRKLIRIETRLGAIDDRLSSIDNRLNAIESNSITQTTILRSMQKLIKQICKHFNNNVNGILFFLGPYVAQHKVAHGPWAIKIE